MTKEHEDKIRAIIAATGAHGIAADAIFTEIDAIVDEERWEAKEDGFYDGQRSAECQRSHSDY